MTTVFTARRRAEEFNSLIEGSSTSDARYADLVELVGSLRAEVTVLARPDFVASLRAQLMVAADTALAGAPTDDLLRVAPRRTARERRLAAAIGSVAILGATTSMAIAAQGALPGDTLYPLKRALENAHTGLSFGEDDRGETMLANASGRLEEVQALSLDTGGQRDQITATLQAFTDQASQAAAQILQDPTEENVTELRTFTGDSLAMLVELADTVPAEARPAFIRAAQVLAQIDAQAAQACPSCPGKLPQIPPFAETDLDGLLHLIDSPLAAKPGPPASPQQGDRTGKPGHKNSQGGGKDTGGSQQHAAEGSQQPGDTETPESPEGPEGPVIAAPPETPDSDDDGSTGNQDGDDPVGDLLDNATGGSSTPSSAPTDVGDVAPGVGAIIP